MGRIPVSHSLLSIFWQMAARIYGCGIAPASIDQGNSREEKDQENGTACQMPDPYANDHQDIHPH